MTRHLSNRVWLVILALSVGAFVACSSSTTTVEDKDSGAVSSSKESGKGSTSGKASGSVDHSSAATSS